MMKMMIASGQNNDEEKGNVIIEKKRKNYRNCNYLRRLHKFYFWCRTRLVHPVRMNHN